MKLKNSLLLLLTASIWGVAFVAQSVGMDYVGPWTFLCARSVLAGAALLLVQLVLRRAGAPDTRSAQEKAVDRVALLRGGAVCGIVLCAACALQQIGILYTTVGKSGFLTACYILIVPLLGLLFGRKCGARIWLAVALALVGLYFLCMRGGLSLGLGDGLTLGCALLFSLHILVTAHYCVRVPGVALSCVQFFVCALVSGVFVLALETPSLSQLLLAWKPVLYAGLLSSAVGYTLQIIGQRGMNPTVASLIMSMESVISVLAGWALLGQALSRREVFGCALMFAAIVLAQLPERARAAANAPHS